MVRAISPRTFHQFSIAVAAFALASSALSAEPPRPLFEAYGDQLSGGAQQRFGSSQFGTSRVNYVYAANSGALSQMRSTFALTSLPTEAVALHLTGRDNDLGSACAISISLNGHVVFSGANDFPKDEWVTREFSITPDMLQLGKNELVIANTQPTGPAGGPPWFMVSRVMIAPSGYVPPREIPMLRPTADAAPLRMVGVGKVDITPTFPVVLNGYAGRPHRLSLDVAAPLYARAISIGGVTKSSKPFVIIAVDNLGIPAAMHQAVASALESKHGIDRSHVAINATHTHSAPMLTDVANTIVVRDLSDDERLAMERYTQELTEKLIVLADTVLSNGVPCQLAAGRTTVGFAKNRRGAPQVDHNLPVLRAIDEQGKIVALVANYACHCVSAGSGLAMCGDWAGFAATDLETELPSATAVILVGCGADINPAATSGLPAAKVQGSQLADAVLELPGVALNPIGGDVTAQLTEVQLPLKPLPSKEDWQARAGANGIVGYHARKNLARLERGEALPTAIDYPIQTCLFGEDLAMVFLAGEVVVDYSLILNETFDASRLWVMGYTNDAPCYIPSERILREGGYEGGDAMVWYDKPVPFAPGLEAIIVDEVGRQLGGRFGRDSNPKLTGGTRPLSPADSIAAMQTHDDLRVELVAAEPLVVDPVAIDFGHDGKLWVAEMHDYPEGVDGKYAPGGRIKFLEDTNGDGQYDKATVLLEGVAFTTGVKAWRKGVLVCAAPDVLYAEDTTGDGTADVVTKVLTGFETQNYQARVNSLSLGLENWMHGAAGIFGGQIAADGIGSVDARNRDFRFRVDGKEPKAVAVEAVSGRTQQGRARDDWGNWFGCENGTLLFHYPTTDYYHRRNPHVASPAPSIAIAKTSRLFPRGKLVQWAQSGPPGAPTSACGLGIYRDELLGDTFSNNAFVCEPVNQLVHRMIPQPVGVTFSAVRPSPEVDREFLSSTDNWFRPVQSIGGPDGALYIVDMYRYMIEHPRFLSAQARAGINVRAGDRMGRIYRVVPRDHAPQPIPNLTALSTSHLVATLDTPNGTLRDMVHLELLWRHDASAAPALRALVRTAALPQVRLQALCALDGLGKLDTEMVQAALSDASPQVRRHGVRLSEPWLNSHKELATRVVELASDDEPQVVMQVAYSLGAWSDAKSAEALIRLALATSDHYIRAAAFSSFTPTTIGCGAASLLERAGSDAEARSLVASLLPVAIKLGDDASLGQIVDALLGSREPLSRDWQWSLVPQLLPALRARGFPIDGERQRSVAHLVDDARAALDDETAPGPSRVLAIGVIAASAPSEEDLTRLADALSPRTAVDVQRAAIAALANVGTPESAALLCDSVRKLTPQVQEAALDALLGREPLAIALLDRIATNELPRSLIDPARAQSLLHHPSKDIQARAKQVVSAPSSAEIADLRAKFAAIDPGRGDYAAGLQVFTKHCATCHRMGEVGHDVGPDLSALTDRSAPALLASIVDPNAAVDARYATYAAVTSDGRVVTGTLNSETGTSITLKAQEGKTHTIVRGDLEELVNTGKSLMPEGLARELAPDAMEHLLAFLAADPSSTMRFRSSRHPAVAEMAEVMADVKLGTSDENRVFPTVFNVAIAAGRRNDADELREVLDFALPQPGQPLRDWQAVVIGGGVVNGISQAGPYPLARILEIVGIDNALLARWNGAIKQSLVMSDNATVNPGTRYDALRMVAALPWEAARPTLEKYLTGGTGDLLQGAVSGLADVPHAEAAALLAQACNDLPAPLRAFAEAGLLRTDGDTNSLLSAIAAGAIEAHDVPSDIRTKLLGHSNERVKALAQRLFKS